MRVLRMLAVVFAGILIGKTLQAIGSPVHIGPAVAAAVLFYEFFVLKA